jgi:NADH:ubiquinone oxidoreductase subunit F (NADH-binding)
VTLTDSQHSQMRVSSSRVFAAWNLTGRSDLRAHLSVYGQLELETRGRKGVSGRLLEEVRLSGLTGRGGAGFPTARKWDAMRHSRHPLLVVNAMEGEPASEKNRALLVAAPHLVLDGAETTALALGIDRVVVCVADDLPDCTRSLELALAERAGAGMGRVGLQVLEAPSGYVSGEESALIDWLGGGEGKPKFRQDKAVPLEIKRQQVLVQNCETLAHVALIARYGSAWFRSAGVPDAPGTAIVTLSGAVEHPGVYEIALGDPIGHILDRARPRFPLSAVLTGGYGGTWIEPEKMNTPFAPKPLSEVGASMGPGIIVALPAASCGVAETARVASHMAYESAGQCGPCVNGLPAIASDLALLARGDGDQHSLARMRYHLDVVAGRGACRHPDGVVRLVRSALEVFISDFTNHARNRPCDGVRSPPVLRVTNSAEQFVRLHASRPRWVIGRSAQ